MIHSYVVLVLDTRQLIFYCPKTCNIICEDSFLHVEIVLNCNKIIISFCEFTEISVLLTWFNSFMSEGDKVKICGFSAWNLIYRGTQRQMIGRITAKTQNLHNLFGPFAGLLFDDQGLFSKSIVILMGYLSFFYRAMHVCSV